MRILVLLILGVWIVGGLLLWIAQGRHDQLLLDWETQYPPGQQFQPGEIFASTVIAIMDHELHSGFGWRPNDFFLWGPTLWADDNANRQLGILQAVRESVRVFKDHLTKVSSNEYDPDLLEADTLFRNDAKKLWFPSAESRFSRAIRKLRDYVAGLRDGSQRSRPITTRNVELVRLFQAWTDLLGDAHANLYKAREVDGILIVGVVDAQWVLEVMDAGVPVVLLDNYLPNVPIPAVVNDNTGGAFTATRSLAALGHKRIGFIGAAVDYPFGRETRDGYHQALGDAGLPYDPALELSIPIDVGTARQAGAKLLSIAERPTAVFAVTDMMAFGVIKAARDQGLAIPTDLSVVGMDDIELAAVTDPPLTTVRIRKEEMGRRAALMLLDLIRGNEVDHGVAVLSTNLIVRGTTGGRP